MNHLGTPYNSLWERCSRCGSSRVIDPERRSIPGNDWPDDCEQRTQRR